MSRDGERLTAAERRDAERLRAYRRRRRLIRGGQVLMGLGLLVAVAHWLAHLGAFGGSPTGLTDLLVGYPTAGGIFITGAILAGQRTY